MKFISPAYYLILFRCLNGRKLDLTNESSLSLSFFPLHFRVNRGKHTKLIRNETAGKAGEKQKEKSWNGMIMTITPSPLYGPNIYLCSLWSPLVEFSTGGVLWKTKTQPKQPKTMTGVGEPRGATSYWTGFLYSLQSISCCITCSLAPPCIKTSKTKNLYLEIYPKKVRPGTLTEHLPPFKTKKQKTKQPKMSKKKRAK